jgi:ABC-type antimicrobial peptide transport system permease subunit
VRTGGPTQDIQPEFYIPIAQAPTEAWLWVNRTLTLVARTRSGDAASIGPTLRSAVTSVDPGAAVFGLSSMSDRVSESLAESRFHLELLVSLGIVGLLLAAAGIYSVVAYFVALRSHEVGVRMALGATTADVVRLMTWQGLRPVIAGGVVGGITAAWTARLLRGSLYGVDTADPVTLVSVGVLLIVVATVAIVIPARRVASVDPTAALHG